MRNRLVALLLLPVLSLVFIIGWFMYFIGDKSEQNRKHQKAVKKPLINQKKKENTKFGLIEELAEENTIQE